jgi:histidine ammonia-lyase
MVVLDGSPLSVADVVAVARHGAAVSVAGAARERMRPARELVERIDAASDVVYGVTTGFGALADRAVSASERVDLQTAVIRSHAAGMGDALPAEVVRGMMLLRARTLCAGYSGVRPALVDAMVALLNAGVVPWVPVHGSLGASGDLAPLAHCAAVLLGEGWVLGADGVSRVAAADALRDAGLAPIAVGPKEGLALINGTDAMCACLALGAWDLSALLAAADAVCALSVEALLGTARAFAADIVGLRPSAGVAASAANLSALLADSPMVASHLESHHAVQDAYSLRCAPQVHGAARDVLGFVASVVAQELASVVDNPLVMVSRGEVVSSGNFHGAALAYAADMCASLCADVAAISERRVDRLLDPARSRGLPAFLTRSPGVNSGLMIAQYTASSCVASLRAAATPFAVQSMSVSGGQEDHVSMGWNACWRTRSSVVDLRRVLAVEAVCAAQALELRAPLRPGPATAALLASLRSVVPFLDSDRVLAGDLLAADGWLESDAWRAALRDASVAVS